MKIHSFKTLALAALLISVMGFLFYFGNALLVQRAPAIELTDKIKIHTTTAHLWFEEILSGDRSENIEDVWYHLNKATWYSNALLQGGMNDNTYYYPVKGEALRKIAVKVELLILDFKQIAELRYEKRLTSYAGTILDKQFDVVYLNLMESLDEMNASAKGALQYDIRKYQFISLLLIIVSIIVAVFLIRSLNRQEKDRLRLMNSLQSAKDAIEEKNKYLHRQAHFDSLTGLPNRMLLSDRLEQAKLHADRSGQTLAVLFIDLDHFKEVNDQYGHATGDKLLKVVAARINKSVRATDTAARISGDEFVVIMEGMKDSDIAVRACRKVACSLIEILSMPSTIDEKRVTVSASIGASIYPQDASNEKDLMRFADNAMYYAKSMGKNNFQFYSQELNSFSAKQVTEEEELKHAIEKEQFVIHYQPIWDFSANKVSGMEALLRWSHPVKGLIYPQEFIPIAEKAGWIHKIDLLVARKVLQQQKEWIEKNFSFGIISVNISSESFKNTDFLADLCHLISDTEGDAKRLEIEIKEQVLANEEYIRHIFNRLKSLGVRLSLDNFGSDMSSIKSLEDYRFDTVKIDRSYTKDQVCDKTIAIVLENIIRLANELGIEVIAEGIETPEQMEKLEIIGCHSGQGNALTKPMDAEHLEEQLGLVAKSNILQFKR